MTQMMNEFKLCKEIGDGYSCRVYAAEHQVDKTMVALKVMDLGTSPQLFAHMQNELTIASRLSHPNILQVLEASTKVVYTGKTGSTKDTKFAYIASEFMLNGELFDTLKSKGALPLPVVKYYGRQLLSAVHHMHTQGVAHRDIKCENILLDADFNLKVIDFGFTSPLECQDGSGFANEFVGTRPYMAPEIVMRRPYQLKFSDIFAIGVVLFMMYTGSAPFEIADCSDPFYQLLALNR